MSPPATNEELTFNVDQFFLLWASALVFSMHIGFAMLSAGAVRRVSVVNITLSIFVDAALCAVAWWLCGYAFAYGGSDNGFIGYKTGFAGVGLGDDYSYGDWLFQFCFAATAATIVSGTIAERASFKAYMSYSLFLSLWVYPVVVFWVWGGGFLTLNRSENALLSSGSLDFAGCGPVHLVGGVAGLVGSHLMGPRRGRYDFSTGEALPMPGHNVSLAVLGVWLLWVGWLGFNAGSALTITTGNQGQIAGRAASNTILSSASGALTSLFVSYKMHPDRNFDIGYTMNGLLGGLVAITGCCAAVRPWAALIIGALGGLLYYFSSGFVLNTLKVDDPLDATAVHASCGMLGLLVGGFFADPSHMSELTGSSDKSFAGIFYGGDGSLLLCGVIEIVCVWAWVCAWMGPFFYALKKKEWLRVSEEVELEGLDSSVHGSDAYPELFHAFDTKPAVEEEPAEDDEMLAE